MGRLAVASLKDLRRDEARMRLLRYLTDHPDATTRQIAVDLGVSNGAAYYLLKALLDKGFVKARRFASSNRKGQYFYVLTPEGISHKLALTRSFFSRKQEEYKALQAEIHAMEQEMRVSDDVAASIVSDAWGILHRGKTRSSTMRTIYIFGRLGGRFGFPLHKLVFPLYKYVLSVHLEYVRFLNS